MINDSITPNAKDDILIMTERPLCLLDRMLRLAGR